MNMNPIYKRETKAAVRTIRLPLIIVIFNGLLALVALLSMYSNVEQVKVTADIQYTAFLDLYGFVGSLEFVLLILIMPALTSSTISSERERKTLDIMLTTGLTPEKIVQGKLAAACTSLFLIIVSSFPVMALVFVYGGIRWKDIGMLMMCYLVSALFAGSIGICCSAGFKKSTVSTVAAYGIMAVVVAGTYAANEFAASLSRMEAATYTGIQAAQAEIGSGGFIYLLLANPAVTFFITISKQLSPAEHPIENWFGGHQASIITDYWIWISMAVQLAAAVILILLAIRMVNPKRWRK